MATITAELVGDMQVTISSADHSWTADEPTDVGGTDTGPDPYELLLGALAACTCITVSMYARRKGIVLTSVSADYAHEKVHADDCGDCDDDLTGFIDRVTARIYLEGDFDDETRARLQQIATRCPVHKTLEKGTVFAETVFAG
ncbi:MAG: OsmC family protein [Actinomycetia bacterium]|nr:OsmC family protein [Actinomycetes bacterium]